MVRLPMATSLPHLRTSALHKEKSFHPGARPSWPTSPPLPWVLIITILHDPSTAFFAQTANTSVAAEPQVTAFPGSIVSPQQSQAYLLSPALCSSRPPSWNGSPNHSWPLDEHNIGQ
uniref:Uncharacterized protein n=1 Tax=Knipowitschia caucasica TaxID=637954 RepID=A0AAV2KP17_KNICA